MASRERLRAVLSGGVPDRTPFFPCIAPDHACEATGHSFEEALARPDLAMTWTLEANLLYGSDATRVRPTPPRSWFERKEVRREGDRLAQVDRATGQIEGHFDVMGGGALIPSSPPAPVRALEDAQRIAFPSADEIIGEGCLDAARSATDAAHERGLFVVGMAAGQTLNALVARMGDAGTAMVAMVDQPGFVRAVFRKATDASIELIAAYARIGVDGIYIGDSYASASVISPAMYEAYCVPEYRRAAEACRARGLLVYKHCCGDYNPLLEIVRREPLDGIEGIDPTSGMSVARTRAALGNAKCMIGGVSCLSLLNGSPEDVRAEARRCIREGGPRYVLGSACAVPRHSPRENLIAMGRAALP